MHYDPFESNSHDSYDKQDDRKKSWRDIDRGRDGSLHRKEERPENTERGRQTERYKRQLEELFTPGANRTPEQEKHLKKIRQAKGGKEIDRACHLYLKKFPMPADWESLMIFLDASDATVVLPTLQQAEKLFTHQSTSAQNNFKQQLRILKMTAVASEVRDQVESLIKKLN